MADRTAAPRVNWKSASLEPNGERGLSQARTPR